MPRFDRLEFDDATPDDEPRLKTDLERGEAHWLGMADKEWRQGHFETALRYYSRALEHNKGVIAAWVGQVRMLVLLGEFPEAEVWSRKALEVFKNHPDLLAGQAQALGRLGDRKRAMATCDKAFAQAGESAYRWLVRGDLLAGAKQDMDRHCFDKAAAADPDWLVRAEAGIILLYHKQPSKALSRLRAALELEPESVFVWLLRSECEDKLGLPSAARQSLKRCLEITPGHTEASLRLSALDHRPGMVGKLLKFLGVR